MSSINLHHLRYFWVIARERSLTRAAARLHVSASAMSIQLKQLEERLGHQLFERRNRQLLLTEAGRLALEYAETIFRAGDELLAVMKGGGNVHRDVLRVGAVATMSRNFQARLLAPMLQQTDVELVLRSGSLRELLAQLDAHALDLLLSNVPVPRDSESNRHSHLLAEIPVSLVGKPGRKRGKFRFPEDLAHTPVLLPSVASNMRVAFDLLLDQAGIRPIILAEVDDMAMLRLLARESAGVTLVPPVVVRDELRKRELVEYCPVPAIQERFYAITKGRRFPNPRVRELLARAATAVQ